MNNEKKMESGTYIIDKEYNLLSMDALTKQWYADARLGEKCYKTLALRDTPCTSCSCGGEHRVLAYNPVRKELYSSCATPVEILGHGEGYCIQFTRKGNCSAKEREEDFVDNVYTYIKELQGNLKGFDCVFSGYCEPKSPVYYINQKFAELLGYQTIEELKQDIDNKIMNFIHPEDRSMVREDMAYGKSGEFGFTSTFRVRKKDGSWILIYIIGTAMETQDGRLATICVCNEVSELLRIQESVSVNEEKLKSEYLAANERASLFESIAASIPAAYHRCTPEEGFPVVFISNSFLEVIQMSRETFKEKCGNKYFNLVAPEDRELFLSYEPELREKGRVDLVYRIIRNDNSRRWVRDVTTKVEQNGEVFYQCALLDITDYIEEINAEKDKAEASARAKSAFLFNASHDIRTPMNAIQGFARIIEDNLENPSVARKALNKLKASCNILSTLLNDVLDLSKIEQGKDDIIDKPVNMELHMEKLYELFVTEMKQSGIRFSVERNIQHPHVIGDELKLTRIAMNLLSNARKFTPKGGTVEFGIIEENYNGTTADYRLFVHDTGIGMSADFQKKAFGQFERERNSTETGIIGSGLGLAIVDRYVNLMHGTCEIKSELGKGTQISVSIPLRVSTGMIFCEEQKIENPDFSGSRILLVEDNEFNREIARYVLENMKFQVDEAEDGSVCIEKLLKAGPGHYSLVLMDIQMPVMNGYVATKEIRTFADAGISSIPIIAMTANAFDEDKRKCLECGMNGHISKPLDSESLLKEMTRVIKGMKS